MPKTYAARVIINVVEDNKEWEIDTGENLRDKFEEDGSYKTRGLTRNELVRIDVVTPDSKTKAEQNKVKIATAVQSIQPLPQNSILYIIGHSDPDTQRFAGGLEASDWEQIIGNGDRFKNVTRIHLVGCHTAGEAKSGADALNTKGTLTFAVKGWHSFAGLLHQGLSRHGMRPEVASYSSYVRVSAMGVIKTGFDEKGGRERHTEGAKVVFSWDDDRSSTRSMTFPH